MIVAAIAVSALGIYLVIAAAVALFGWLAATIATKRSPSTPQVVEPTTPSSAAPPSHQYLAVVPVDAAVFDDARALSAQARVVFNAWASQLPKAPRDAASTLRGMALRRRLIGRFTSRLDGRRFVWRASPYRGGNRNVGVPTLDVTRLDPYAPPPDLRSRSSYLELCHICAGDGRCECISCGASGRVICAACVGAGKVHGIAKNGARRLLNCKDCKGKGGLTCRACAKGHVSCTSCAASGRIERWLDLEGGPREGDIQVEPDGDLTRAFTWGRDGAPATADEIARDARVVAAISQPRQLTLADLPPDVPRAWIDAHWDGIQARLQPGERIVDQTFTLLEVPSVELTYGIGKSAQAIQLEGLRMLAPPVTADHLFASRAASLRRLALVLAAIPAAVFVAYAIRGSYFLTSTTAGVIACAALACGILYAVIWHTSLGRSAWRWLGAAAVPVAAATSLAILSEPTEARARELIARGQLALAKIELEALGSPDSSALWADVHLAEALGATTCTAASERASLLPAGSAQLQRARAHADALALHEAEARLTGRDPAGAVTALTCASDTIRKAENGRTLEARVHLATARACLDANDWACAYSRADEAARLGATGDADTVRAEVRAKVTAAVDDAIASSRNETDLAKRVSLQRNADELWTRYLLAGAGTVPPPLEKLRASLVSDQRRLDRELEVARKNQEREERRARERAEREARAAEQRALRAQREQERRERARDYAPLLCGDGSLSPSCVCGGSHRGCCSHHGGVAGCSAD
ncbi:MAG TPA: hypothetical protein VM513_10160 [Kofleriaceae bacterium]|nr:hypothetical protein [Kofleriaceae bacterium]